MSCRIDQDSDCRLHALATIQDIRIGHHPASGLSTAPYLSDDGEVVFFANFTDNSGAILIWSPVPEPASLVLAAWLAAAVARRRRRPLVRRHSHNLQRPVLASSPVTRLTSPCIDINAA